jgi:pimeloyl-ACP methyl ester carboxylesterase
VVPTLVGSVSRRAAAVLVALTSAAWLVASCAPAPPEAPPGDVPAAKTLAPPFGGKPRLSPPDMTDDGPGSLISVEPLKGADLLDQDDALYMRIVYRSTSGVDGSPTEVSGAVAIPPGNPPKGGWPVLAFGQGTKGVLEKCASSLYGSLPLNQWTMSVFVQAGFAVAVTDFQGAGVKGYQHPFLDGKTYGYNVIDSVRAARRVGADLSDKWLAYGHSAGGLAVWAAAEQAPTYGQGLDLLGTVSMAPAADMAGLADAAWNGTLTDDQRITLVFALQSLKWFNPDMNLDNYRRGATAANWDELLDCIPPNFDDIARVRALMTNDDLKPATEADYLWLRDRLQALAVPQARIESPIIVGYGTQDTLVNEKWFEKALDRACAMGSPMEIRKGPGKGHADLDSGYTLPWLMDRLAGITPPPDNCAGRN